MKNPLNSRRRLALFLSTLVLLVVGGRWVGKEIKRGWREAQVHGVGGGMRKYVRFPTVSDEFNDFNEWLINDLVRSRRPWSMGDADRLIGVLDNPPTEKYITSIMREDTTPREAEWLLKYNSIMPAISERIRHNDPMAPGVKEALSAALIAQLDVPIQNTQLQAVQAVTNAHLVQIPLIRAKLVAMRQTTNDPRVASTIEAQLNTFDTREDLRRKGKWSERGVDIIPQ